MNTRPDPWTSGNGRDIETTVWQRPPQPPADKYALLKYPYPKSHPCNNVCYPCVLVGGITVRRVIHRPCQ